MDDLLEAVAGAVCVPSADAAVRNERVHRTPRRSGRGKCGVDDIPVADVAEVRVTADRRGHLLELVHVRGEEREHRAFGGKALGDRPPDPLATAGDDDMPARESLHWSPLSLFA